jgi:hypothetical protein
VLLSLELTLSFSLSLFLLFLFKNKFNDHSNARIEDYLPNNSFS